LAIALDQIIVGWTTKEVFAVHNLRQRDGQWLIDVTYAAKKKTETKVIGPKLSWQKVGELIPEAVFRKNIQQHLLDSRIVSFVNLTVKTEIVDRSKGGKVSEVSPTSIGQFGTLLINIATGNEIAQDIRAARVRNF
jgi:hypothetical protein